MACICLGTGFVLAKERNQETATLPYAFRCQCSAGRAKSSTRIPLWYERHATKFEPLSGLALQSPPEPKPEEKPELKPEVPSEIEENLW